MNEFGKTFVKKKDKAEEEDRKERRWKVRKMEGKEDGREGGWKGMKTKGEGRSVCLSVCPVGR